MMHSISLSLSFGTAAVGGFLGVDSKQALHFEENSEISTAPLGLHLNDREAFQDFHKS